MDVPLRMPDLATTGASIKVLRWLVEPGRLVRRGEPLLEVETDKAVMQVEAAAEGLLKTLVASEGDEIDAGQTIAILEGESAAKSPLSSRPSETTVAHVPLPREKLDSGARHDGTRTSFFARNREARAQARSGRKSATTGTDVASRTIPLSVPQKVAARRMSESKRTIPHFYLQTSANAGRMVARRLATSSPIVWDAIFVHAAGKALQSFERMACRFEDDHLVVCPVPAIGVAVDIDDELFTIAVERPAEKSLEVISQEITSRLERLRAGDPLARIAAPACMTISNLGGSGIESFGAVINPPESAILAVGKVMPVAVVAEGQIVAQHRINLTLSVDHRVVNGKYAAGFLNAIVRELESTGRAEASDS